MDNVRPEGTEDQSVTYPSREALVNNVHVRHSECIINSPPGYNPVFGAFRYWKNDDVANIVYMV